MNAMVGIEAQKGSFSSRLKRIQAGGENTTKHIYVGPVEESAAGRPVKHKKKSKSAKLVRQPKDRGSFFKELFMTPIAIAAGAICVVAGRAIEFHFVPEDVVLSMISQNAPFLIPYMGYISPNIGYLDIVIAMVLAVILGKMFHLRVYRRGRAQFVGFAAMLLLWGAAMAEYPQVFEKIYSAEYVAEVLARYTA